MKKVLTLGLILILLGVSVIPSTGTTDVKESIMPTLDGNILYVGGDGEGNYSKIQDAIDNASDGDMVYVYNDSSPYYENVVVDKSINLTGEDRETTVIDGGGSGDGVYISADWVNIGGFTIRNCTKDCNGIRIISDYNIITNNTVESCFRGIFAAYSGHDITISNNKVRDAADHGIYLDGYVNSLVTDNLLENNRGNLHLTLASYNQIVNNTIKNGSYYGLHTHYYCNHNLIKGNNILNNSDVGLWVNSFDYNNITENTFAFNDIGIRFHYHWSGVADYNIITGNNISNNKYGMYLDVNGFNNTIYHNNFINNGENAYDECNNTWDDGKYGNYWSDYKEKYPDAKKKWLKGIWDTPYEILGGDNKDMCPLIKQYPDSVSKTNPESEPFNFNFNLLSWLFERFPNTFPILRLLLRLQ